MDDTHKKKIFHCLYFAAIVFVSGNLIANLLKAYWYFGILVVVDNGGCYRCYCYAFEAFLFKFLFVKSRIKA